MGTLTAEQILSATDIKLEQIEVPEWGGSVYLRTIRVCDKDQLENLIRKAGGDTTGIRTALLSMTLCNENGTRIFEDDNSAKKIGGLSSAPVERLFEAACKLNGILGDDSLDDAAGN